MQEAGADALELNIYYIPVDPKVTGEQVEEQYVGLVKAVKAEVKIPVAVKLGPYFSSMANMAQNWMARASTPWCSSTASTSRISTWKRWRWCQPDSEQLARVAAAPALDRGVVRQRESDWLSLARHSAPMW